MLFFKQKHCQTTPLEKGILAFRISSNHSPPSFSIKVTTGYIALHDLAVPLFLLTPPTEFPLSA